MPTKSNNLLGKHPPQYDPILYAFMRACGAPSRFYNAYRRQLGYGIPRKKTARRLEYESLATQPLPTWANSKIRVLAAMYYGLDHLPVPSTEVCAQQVNDILDEIDAAPSMSAAQKSGLTRKLHHAQARWYAAIMRVSNTDIVTYQKQPRAVSELVAISRADRWANVEKRKQDRMQRKYAKQHSRNQQLAFDTAWHSARDAYHDACHQCEAARARYNVLRDRNDHVLAERRLSVGISNARTPKAMLDELAVAKSELRHWLTRRRITRKEFAEMRRQKRERALLKS